MKVAFVSFFNPSQSMAASARLSRMIDFFQSKGIQVQVVCPAQERFIVGSSGVLGKLKKALIFFSTLIDLIDRSLKSDAGFYYVSAPPISMLIPALVLVFKKPGKVIFEERDLLTTNPLINFKLFRANPLARFVEGIVLSKSRAVVALTSNISKDLIQHWPDKLRDDHVLTVTNGFYKKDYATLSEKLQKTTIEKRPHIRLLHAGNFYGSRNPYPLLKALQYIKAKHEGIDLPFEIVFMGRFESLERQEEFLQASKVAGLEDLFKILPLKPRVEALQEMAEADALILITHAEGSEFAVPAKLYEYIAVGKPILAITHDPLTIAPIEKHVLGWCAAHDEIQKIAQVLEDWMKNPEALRQKRLPGLSLVEYDAEAQMSVLYEKIKRMAAGTA